jgi:ectoine hydroxylase-related dioxygenase (phytanoyl-CoA dioxygenase family)
MNLLRSLKHSLKQALPLLRRQPVYHPQLPGLRTFSQHYFADQALDLRHREMFQAHQLPASGPLPWLDRPDALEVIQRRQQQGELSETAMAVCTQYAQQGYVILKQLLDHPTIDEVWGAAYDRAVPAGRIKPAPEQKTEADPYPGHVMNAHLQVPEIQKLFADPQLLAWVELLLGRSPIPFQTLLFPKGREQLAHSDSIHMTTYPLGYLCAAWIALEDIHPDSGPLVYYPGSHRLPYVFSVDVGLSPTEFRDRQYAAVGEKYEPYIQQLIQEKRLQPQCFHPQKGDVLLWHANLLHGGSERRDIRHSRKSLVCHYFARGAFCYHDLSGSPADRVL